MKFVLTVCLFLFVNAEKVFSENQTEPTKQHQLKIGGLFSVNFFYMDNYYNNILNNKILEPNPEKYRGFSIGMTSEMPLKNYESIVSMFADVLYETMPTYDIDKIYTSNEKGLIIKNTIKIKTFL